MGRLTYENKVSIISDSTPRKNKATAQDFNEIKASVNAIYDINDFVVDDEVEIGTYLGKKLYKKTIKINKSQISFANNMFTFDTTSLGAKEVFIDFTHTYLLNVIQGENDEQIKTHYTVNSSIFSNSNTYGNFLKYSFNIYNCDCEVVEIYIGTELQTLFKSIYLTLEYTKE
jgi:hypothetical protein